ncbi:S8 family serine peptidase [Streptomyces geranii]|uniref:S8 family serine peptidase n=1 Tax=Streptomyces geranii TaxID=2058923 RepID=UPI000D02A0BF|nr:S8 family serine peptidase [Streptomyces geranii]
MAHTTEVHLPPIVYAHASPRSRGDISLFEADSITTENATEFISDEDAARRAETALAEAGFTILGHSPATINIAGPPELYESYFHTELKPRQRQVIKPGAVDERRLSTFIDTATGDLRGFIATDRCAAAAFLEGVALEQPAVMMSDRAAARPSADQPYLTLDQVAENLGVRPVREKGIIGQDVRLTMVDTGWERHRWFADRKLTGRVVPGPGAEGPEADPDGHGTAESANAFAVAPGIDFTMVKSHSKDLLGAFNIAVAQDPKPQIISCSLAYDIKDPEIDDPFLSAVQQAFCVALALAVVENIVVVCAAGNGHHAFPAQHPDVIAVGGVHVDLRGQFEASDYASGFRSKVFPGRTVPDLCGLVGMQPNGAYIRLPAPAGSEIDRNYAEYGDGTKASDGWIVSSGTSAAAPQLAGICALLLQAYPKAKPHEIREALRRGATDVVRGHSNLMTGGVARPGHDPATGYGLANATKSLLWLGDHPTDR